MKKILFSMVVCVFAFTFNACNDDDKLVNTNELPLAAKTFLDTYFQEQSILETRKDKDDYTVHCTNYIIEFDLQGIWDDVDRKLDNGQYKALPEAFLTAELPAGLLSFINTNYLNNQIIEVDKEYKNNTFVGYEIDLSGGAELDFDKEGNLIGSGGTSAVELPQAAKDFMSTHFSGLAYTTIKDKDDYDVYTGTHKIEFDLQGNWEQIDGYIGSVKTKLPESFLAITPINKINDFVQINHEGQHYIIEIEKDYENGKLYYDIELDNQTDLIFDTEGAFVR